MGERWVLLDGRAHADIESAYVLLVGSKRECQEAAENGDFGEGCLAMSADEYGLVPLFPKRPEAPAAPKERS